MNLKKRIKISARGMGLVEVLIAIGIMSVVLTAFATMMNRQQRENKYVQQLQEVSAYQTYLNIVFAKPEYCLWDLAGQKINATTVSDYIAAPDTLSLNDLYSGPDNGSLLIMTTVAGQTSIPDSQSGLRVQSIQFGQIFATADPDKFKGTLTITFDSTSTIRSLPTIQIPFIASALPVSGTNPVSARPFYCSVKPSNLTLTHVPNDRNFTISWTAGLSNGGPNGCKLQYQKMDTSWADISSPLLNCDADLSAQSITLPGDGWLGAAWASGRQVQILRIADNFAVGTFPGLLTCIPKPDSPVPTPTIDEDCDNNWDNSAGGYKWNAVSAWAGGNNCPRYNPGIPMPAVGSPCTMPTGYQQNWIYMLNGSGPYADACPGQGAPGGSIVGVQCGYSPSYR